MEYTEVLTVKKDGRTFDVKYGYKKQLGGYFVQADGKITKAHSKDGINNILIKKYSEDENVREKFGMEL